jgi:hypothetical protein
MNQVSNPSSAKESVCSISCYIISFSFSQKIQVVTSTSYNVAKAGNPIQYHEQLDQLKQKISENEKKMDEWNKVQKPIPHVQKPVIDNHNFRPTPM